MNRTYHNCCFEGMRLVFILPMYVIYYKDYRILKNILAFFRRGVS